MPKFTIRAHVEPDTEMGPGEPDMDDKGTGKSAKLKGPMKKNSQFSLPKSGGKKPPPMQKVKM